MATKRKRTKSRRRRRMGAAGLNLASPVVKLAAVAGAYFLAADPVNNFADGILTKLPMLTVPAVANDTSGTGPKLLSTTGKYVAVGAEGIGAYMLLMKGRSTMVKTLAGAILAGAALKRALKQFGVVSGYQSVPVIGGYQSVPVIGNYASRPAALNGYGVNGYRVNGYRVNGRPQSVMGSAMDRGSTSGSDLLG